MLLFLDRFNKISFNLGAREFENKIKNTADSVLLDVRTQNEFDTVRIPGSILIDIYKADFISRLDKLDRNKTYFVYCKSGSRSFNAAMQMLNIGFEKVYNLENGIIDWGGEVENN